MKISFAGGWDLAFNFSVLDTWIHFCQGIFENSNSVGYARGEGYDNVSN
jgi:hypothetical protein